MQLFKKVFALIFALSAHDALLGRGSFNAHMTIGKVDRDDWPTCLARLAANIAKPNLGHSGRVVLSIRAGGVSRNEQLPTVSRL